MEKDHPLRKVGRALVKVGLPALGTAIGGPAGGVVAGALASALGVKPEADALDAALASASPEVLSKIKEIEASVVLAELETDRAEMDSVTQRWQADSSSSFWLPNNIRPLVLASSLTFWIGWNLLSLLAIVVFFWKSGEVDESLVGFFTAIGLQITGFLGTASVAYFGARSMDKRVAK